jgi:hypothetical protein
MRGEISLEASAKLCAALLFAEPPPQPFGGPDDCPRAYLNVAHPVASLVPSFIFLFFDPPVPDSRRDVEASK